MKSFIFLLALLFSTTTLAKSNTQTDPDAQKPIDIQADRLLFSNQQGKSIYTGHVIITQGSLTLKGSKVFLLHPNQKIQTVEVFGHPAHFKKFLADEQKWLSGDAQHITYDAKSKTLHLIGNAFVQQGKTNQISGAELFYNLKQQTLEAHSTPTDKERVHVIIQPEQNTPSKKEKTTKTEKNTRITSPEGLKQPKGVQ